MLAVEAITQKELYKLSTESENIVTITEEEFYGSFMGDWRNLLKHGREVLKLTDCYVVRIFDDWPTMWLIKGNRKDK